MLKQFANIKSLKEKRLKQLYVKIYKLGPISKVDLIAETGLTLTTCSRLIEVLLDQKQIIESGVGESSGGRRPHLYEVNVNASYLIGIDISRTYTKILLMDQKLTVLDEARLKMDHTTTPDLTISIIIRKIKSILYERQLSHNSILGIGIGAIGPLDHEKGMILNPSQFLATEWVNVPIQKELSTGLGIDVFIDYGVNTAALAEYEHSFSKTYQNMIYIIKGVGSRAGIIIDGRLKNSQANVNVHGQGHMIVDIHGRKCTCGSNGCVQAYSSIHAITADIKDSLKKGRKSFLLDCVNNIENIQFEDICQAVNNNDPLCSEIVDKAAHYTGIGLSNLINILQPELIILSGPTYRNMDLFYNTVKKIAYNRSKALYPDIEIIFSRGILGENATAIGAGQLVMNHYLD